MPAQTFVPIANSLTGNITISFWTYDIPLQQSRTFHGTNSSGQTVLNCHIPWSDQTVYWDAGFPVDRCSLALGNWDLYCIKNTWNFWVFAKSPTDTGLKIFMNGVFRSWAAGLNKIDSVTNFKFGCDALGNGLFYTGEIDDIRIYDFKFSDADVANMYNGKAVHPLPDIGATGADIDVELTWAPGVYAQTYDVYIGTSQTLVQNATWFGQTLTLSTQVYDLGDLNQDGHVNETDIKTFSDNWLEIGLCGPENGDNDGNRRIDFNDFTIFAAN